MAIKITLKLFNKYVFLNNFTNLIVVALRKSSSRMIPLLLLSTDDIIFVI
jgi:hypothetical protein